MALSMHSLPELYAVWPSPSRRRSTADSSCEASASAHFIGVAGSRVVPTTRIGAAPSPRTSIGFSVLLPMDPRHDVSDQAKIEPKVGEASSKAGSSAATSPKPTDDGSSRQLI